MYVYRRPHFYGKRASLEVVLFPTNVPTTENLVASISSTAALTATFLTPQPLTANINAVGTISTAILETNLEHATNTLAFTQDATNFNQHIGNTLILIRQSVTLESYPTSSSNTLEFTQDVQYDKEFSKNALSVLGALRQSVVFAKVIGNQVGSDTITFTDSAEASRPAISVLVLTDSATSILGGLEETASDTLSLTDSAVIDQIKLESVTSTLLLSQIVLGNYITDKSASNILDLKQVAVGTKIGLKCYVILQAPFEFLQTSIILPCPEFGDTENLASEMLLKRSMNGGTTTYVKTNNRRRLTYTFRILNRARALEFKEFLQVYNTDAIKLTNWKGEIWKVNFLNNPFDLVQTGRSNPGGARTDISVELEGIKLSG